MWLFAVGMSALLAAMESDRQRQSPGRPRLGAGGSLGMALKTTMVILIDDEPYVVREVTAFDQTPPYGEIQVTHAIDGEDMEFMVFVDESDAGQVARKSMKEDLLWGIDHPDPHRRQAAINHVIEYVGAENLVLWALGQPAGPGTTQVNSLEEWFDLFADNPEEHWASEDMTERSIEPHPDDIDEARIMMGTSAWHNMVEELGFEPGVAYRRS